LQHSWSDWHASKSGLQMTMSGWQVPFVHLLADAQQSPLVRHVSLCREQRHLNSSPPVGRHFEVQQSSSRSQSSMPLAAG